MKSKANSYWLKQDDYECFVCKKEYKGLYCLKKHLRTVKSNIHVEFRQKENHWNLQLESLPFSQKQDIEMVKVLIINNIEKTKTIKSRSKR